MQLVSKCSQYYPYAGKTSPCSGNVHELKIIYNDGWLKPTDIQTCDAHMQSFQELGKRQKFQFTIEGDKIIGVITPTSLEGQRSTKEQK